MQVRIHPNASDCSAAFQRGPSIKLLRRESVKAGIKRLGSTLEVIQVGHLHRDDAVAVNVSKRVYVWFWVLMLFARCWCIVFLAVTTRLYWFVAHPYMSYYANLLGPNAAERFKSFGVCFGLIGAAHAFDVLQMVIHSCRLRRLVLDPPPTPITTKTVAPIAISRSFTRFGSRFFALGRRFLKMFHRRGFFGVESDFFHVRFMARELIEIVSQTIQVYKSSVLIAKLWINNLYVVLMLINCCSTPVLHTLFHDSPALERLLCLWCDYVLDSVVSMVVPIIIMTPYYQKFDFASYNFEIAYLYDDIWFANMVMENQQIFALGYWDFVWKVVPHISMYSCLGSLNALIRPAPSEPSHRCLGKVTQLSNASDNQSFDAHPDKTENDGRGPTISDIAPVSSLVGSGRRGEYDRTRIWSSKQHQPTMRTKGIHILRVANGVMFLWGLGIVTLHLMAIRTSLSTDVPGCKQVTRPWFATKFSCSVLQYNCHQYNSTTVRVEDIDILQQDSVVALVFSHCTALVVPTHVRKFRNLLGVDIFNSTLFEWSHEAAISNDTNTRLAYVIFVRVNMTKLPDGILQRLPPSMTDFEISVSNLTHLPDDLHQLWHPMSLLYIEHSPITSFPSTLLHLNIDDLSLIGSDISSVPEFGRGHRGFFTFAMTHTPLTKLPTSFGDTSNIGFLNLGYTSLKSFPPWMDRVVRTATKVYVHHTPFCSEKTSEEIEQRFGVDDVLTCTDTGDRQDGKYPLQLMETRRPYDQPQHVD